MRTRLESENQALQSVGKVKKPPELVQELLREIVALKRELA